jgi:hypothetical protein
VFRVPVFFICIFQINAFCFQLFLCRPAVCLTVPGPGLLHVLAGMQNANENGW